MVISAADFPDASPRWHVTLTRLGEQKFLPFTAGRKEKEGDTSKHSASVVPHFYLASFLRATRPRRTFSKMSSAVAVHTKGLGSLLLAAR